MLIEPDEVERIGLTPEDLRAALPEKLTTEVPGLSIYDEGYAFRSLEEVNRFLVRLERQ